MAPAKGTLQIEVKATQVRDHMVQPVYVVAIYKSVTTVTAAIPGHMFTSAWSHPLPPPATRPRALEETCFVCTKCISAAVLLLQTIMCVFYSTVQLDQKLNHVDTW